MMNQQKAYDAGGAATIIGKSAAWAHLAFKSGVLPTELLLNGRRPMVTERTLRQLAPTLRLRKKHAKYAGAPRTN